MKKVSEWTVSDSVSKTILNTLLALVGFCAVWSSYCVAKWGMSPPIERTLLPLAVVFFLTLAFLAFYFKPLADQAWDYESKLDFAKNDVRYCQESMNKIFEALAMSDEVLMKNVELESVTLKVNGFSAPKNSGMPPMTTTRTKFKVGDFASMTKADVIALEDVRLMLRENLRGFEERLAEIEWPVEPPQVAKWRKCFAPRNLDVAHA